MNRRGAAPPAIGADIPARLPSIPAQRLSVSPLAFILATMSFFVTGLKAYGFGPGFLCDVFGVVMVV
jgi:hypothetical protein